MSCMSRAKFVETEGLVMNFNVTWMSAAIVRQISVNSNWKNLHWNRCWIHGGKFWWETNWILNIHLAKTRFLESQTQIDLQRCNSFLVPTFSFTWPPHQDSQNGFTRSQAWVSIDDSLATDFNKWYETFALPPFDHQAVSPESEDFFPWQLTMLHFVWILHPFWERSRGLLASDCYVTSIRSVWIACVFVWKRGLHASWNHHFWNQNILLVFKALASVGKANSEFTI